MEQKTKLEIFKEKIAELRRRREAKKAEEAYNMFEEDTKSKRGLIAGASLALVAVSLATALIANEATVNHASEVCLATKVLSTMSDFSLVSTQTVINHQMEGIKSDYKDCENLSVECKHGFIVPDGYVLEDGYAVKYEKPQEVVTYEVPEGFILQGTQGVRTLSDGTVETVAATKVVKYFAPEGGILMYDSEGNPVCVTRLETEFYQEPTIFTEADEKIYALTIKTIK